MEKQQRQLRTQMKLLWIISDSSEGKQQRQLRTQIKLLWIISDISDGKQHIYWK
jgi:hypothetical protein